MRIPATLSLALLLAGCGPPPFIDLHGAAPTKLGGVLRVRCDLPVTYCRPSVGMPATLPHAVWPPALFPEEE